MTGYCFKCKCQQELVDANEVTMKNGRKAMRGQCMACGSVVYRFVGYRFVWVAPHPSPLPGGEET